MNKFFIFILCLCCALTVAQATGEDRLNDSDANVFGHVLDKKTGEHLPFINVLLKGTTIGTTTDNSGHYFLKNLPEGKFTLEYKALGYKTISKEVTLKKGKTLEINVELEEDQIALDGGGICESCGNFPSVGSHISECIGCEGFYYDQCGEFGTGTKFPTGCTGRDELPELRFPASPDQWIRRTLYPNTD